ncbi:MAG: hypothetical protein M3O30_04110 [Planctomycetota bacterium]|nr:hypothetical protein [Planctomycetota bacterium]
MTKAMSNGGAFGNGGFLTTVVAVRVAWVAWITFLIIPFLLFLWVVWALANETGVARHQGTSWFVAAMIYLLVAVPCSFFWRGHVFKAYWTGHTVSPGKYLLGMIAVWLALVVGGIFSLVGCYADHSLLPNLLPALVAFMFYVTLWPSGRAMVRHTGSEDDPEVYETPR